MNQRLVLLTVLVLLAGVVVALMAWLSGEVGLHPSASTEPPYAGTAQAALPSHSNVVEASTEASSAAVRDAAAADARTQRPLPDGAQWIEVTVVDKATGTPVPGAFVHWFDNDGAERLAQDSPLCQQQRQMLDTDPERWGEEFGWRTTTDSTGVARVCLVDVTTVVARWQSHYGTLGLQKNTIAPPGGYRLFLTPDLEALVQVLDARGAPAPDVLVAVAVHDRNGTFEYLWNWAPVAVTSAPDGIAQVRHLQTIAASLDAEEREAGKLFRVRTILPGYTDPGVELSMTEPSAEPIVLRLPPCGRVRARAEFAGQPMHGLSSIQLSNAEEREASGEECERVERLPDADGWVRFPRVPLGHRYIAGTDSVGNLRSQFTGPLADDQEVVVLLTPSQDEILLRGRILDEERRPVAEQRFDLQARGPQFRATCALTTDPAGGFLAVLGTARKDNRVDQLSLLLVQRNAAPRRAEATPRELRVGVEDLGDLVLSAGTLLAAGRFQRGGVPHEKRVQFSIERREQVGTRERWRRQNTMNHQTADRFEVRGTVPPGTYRLSFFPAEDSLPIPPLPFALGATGLTVNIDVGHPLAASVLLPENVPESDLTAVLVPAGIAGKAPTPGENPNRSGYLNAQPWCAEGGRYNLQWGAVAAGSYCLELRLWTQPTPLLVIADVQVPAPPGGGGLVDIDLRQLVRVLRVELLDSDGKPPEDPDGVIFPAGQPPHAEWLGYTIDGPSVRLLVAPGPIELIVAAEGHRPTPVLATGDKLQVRLDAWPTITITFSDLHTLPPKVIALASLEPTEKSELRYRSQGDSGNRYDLMRSRRYVTIEGGKATVPIGDGPHSLKLLLQGNRRSVEVVVHTRQFLSTDGQAHVVVPGEQWSKAIESVKQPPK